MKSEILAVVGQDFITITDFKQALNEQSPFMKRTLVTYSRQLDFLKKLILQKILYQEAKKKGYVDDSSVEALKQQAYIHSFLKTQLSKIKLDAASETQLKLIYQRIHKKHMTLEKREASHLYLKTPNVRSPGSWRKTKDRMKALLPQILEANKQEGGFAELVKKHSEDKRTKSVGGKSGIEPSREKGGKWPKYFSKAAFAIKKVGEFSPITKGWYGYHIIRLDKLFPTRPKTYKELLPLLKVYALEERQQKLYEKLTTKFRKETKVQIFQKRFDAFKKTLAVQKKEKK